MLMFFVISLLQLGIIVTLVWSYIAQVVQGTWVEEHCYTDAQTLDDECEAVTHILVLLSFLALLAFSLMMCVCEVQILYYGWREQEMYASGRYFSPAYHSGGEMPSTLPVHSKPPADEGDENKADGEEPAIGEPVEIEDDGKATDGKKVDA
mmetsp:Transcript_22208/g.29717  ORF Transcript_22208/g.29717 Transcript_22208/m.29717 type:complete len:151 (+) Transcript_22208:208-660(+)